MSSTISSQDSEESSAKQKIFLKAIQLPDLDRKPDSKPPKSWFDLLKDV